VFFFGDFEALRRRQGTVQTGSVPTDLERASFANPFINLTDMIQSGTTHDLLCITGSNCNPADPVACANSSCLQSAPLGTVFDPATTRSIFCGSTDPVSGLPTPVCGAGQIANQTVIGFVRTPFGTCVPGTTAFTLSGCNLNMLPAGRIDANAIKLLQ